MIQSCVRCPRAEEGPPGPAAGRYLCRQCRAFGFTLDSLGDREGERMRVADAPEFDPQIPFKPDGRLNAPTGGSPDERMARVEWLAALIVEGYELASDESRLFVVARHLAEDLAANGVGDVAALTAEVQRLRGRIDENEWLCDGCGEPQLGLADEHIPGATGLDVVGGVEVELDIEARDLCYNLCYKCAPRPATPTPEGPTDAHK